MADRTSIHVSLPRPLKRWVERQVKAGDFGTASEYVRSVLRNERSRLEDALVRGARSPKLRMSDTEWERLHDEVRSRVAASRKPKPRRKSA